eukprot:g4129.t1
MRGLTQDLEVFSGASRGRDADARGGGGGDGGDGGGGGGGAGGGGGGGDAFPAAAVDVDALLLAGLTRPQLYTDDTYLFIKASNTVKDSILERVAGTAADDGACLAMKAAVVDCLDVLLLMHRHQWAKAQVQVVFKVATEIRLALPPVLRERLDAMATTLAGKTAKPQAGGAKRLATGADHPLLNL